MARKVVQDSVVPARHGMAFEVKKGQVLRIYQVEEKQVADVVFFNANDYQEWFHVGQTWTINGHLGTGTAKSFKHFYSKPPRENVMLTVLEDSVKVHWGNNGARCSRKMWDLRGRGDQDRSCQQNLEEALAPYGITGDNIGDCFNLFLNVELDADGGFKIKSPTASKGDYIDLLAEMDILTAISACPADTVVNDHRPSPWESRYWNNLVPLPVYCNGLSGFGALSFRGARRRGIWGGANPLIPRFLPEFILSAADGVGMTLVTFNLTRC